MIRRAFTMRLKPGSLAEYRYHHDNIWPELVAEIERSGIASITTFQRDLDLFLVSEIADEAAWDNLWNSPVHQRWAEVMQPLMHLRDDGIVDAGELVEVFHITTYGKANGQALAQAVAGMFEPAAELATEPTLEERLQASDALWREPIVQAAVAAIEATVELMAMEEAAAEASPMPAAEPAGAPPAEVESAPAAKPGRKMAVRRTKKQAAKKAPAKKKRPAKKAKRKTAKRPAKRATKRPTKKGRKKAAKAAPKKSAKKAAKKSTGKKVKKTARKKRAKKRG